MKHLRSSARRHTTNSAQSEDLTANPVGSRPKGLELDLRLREFEINQLTQRNNFFMIFQGVLIAGLVQSQGTSAPIITFSMSLLGMATSALQVGMAGGAKYWQSRWEAATRSSEIAILLELSRRRKPSVQTFTHNSALLTVAERKQIEEWNAGQSDDEQKITSDPDYIQAVVMADIGATKKATFRGGLDWWVRKFAITPKWSVSRIPIWVGAILLIFWTVTLLHSMHIRGINIELPNWWPIELVPLKAEDSKQDRGLSGK